MSYQVERDWTTQAGFRAVVTMGDMGHRCGYVGLPKEHPLYGTQYGDPSPALTAPSNDEPVGKRGVITLLCVTRSGWPPPSLSSTCTAA